LLLWFVKIIYCSSGASFHMTPHSVCLFSLCTYQHCTVHTADGSLLFVAGHDTLYSDSFHVLDVSLVLDLTMKLMSTSGMTTCDG
jgi:hypothetical protein